MASGDSRARGQPINHHLIFLSLIAHAAFMHRQLMQHSHTASSCSIHAPPAHAAFMHCQLMQHSRTASSCSIHALPAHSKHRYKQRPCSHGPIHSLHFITAQFNLLLFAVHLPGTANSLANAHSQYGYIHLKRHRQFILARFNLLLSAVHLPGTANSLADALSHNNPPPPPPPFSVPITHRPTPIPAPVIDLLAHSKTRLDGPSCSALYLVHTHKQSASPLSASAAASSHTLARKEPSAYSWHTSGSSTHNQVLPELRYPIPLHPTGQL